MVILKVCPPLMSTVSISHTQFPNRCRGAFTIEVLQLKREMLARLTAGAAGQLGVLAEQ